MSDSHWEWQESYDGFQMHPEDLDKEFFWWHPVDVDSNIPLDDPEMIAELLVEKLFNDGNDITNTTDVWLRYVGPGINKPRRIGPGEIFAQRVVLDYDPTFTAVAMRVPKKP